MVCNWKNINNWHIDQEEFLSNKHMLDLLPKWWIYIASAESLSMHMGGMFQMNDFGMSWVTHPDFSSFLFWWRSIAFGNLGRRIWLCWLLWKERSNKIFKNEAEPSFRVFDKYCEGINLLTSVRENTEVCVEADSTRLFVVEWFDLLS